MSTLVRAVAAALAASAFCCNQDRSAAVSSAPSSSAASVRSTAADILSAPLRSVMCSAEPCGGDASILQIYRDGSGAVKKVYRLHGGCFHSPGIYFDPDGTVTQVIPEQPISAGSPEALALQAKVDAQIHGLKLTDVVRCRDGARSAP